jgi:diadenylate cyclase
MSPYLPFAAALLLILYRLSLPGKARERFLLVSLFLFLLLTLAVHPWLSRSAGWLQWVERGALTSALLWLALDPLARGLEKLRWGKKSQLLRNGKGSLSEIVSACRMLAESRLGALIAIERKNPLERWVQSGIPLNAEIRRETIYSVFTPPGALHDGGVVILGNRIAAGAVLFPLSKRMDLPRELGTRHRAALGLSELSDALVIAVSEETGKVSLADRGSLLYDVKLERLPEILTQALENRLVRIGRKRGKAEQPALLQEVVAA